jgi:hypothetical protein
MRSAMAHHVQFLDRQPEGSLARLKTARRRT